MRVNSIVPGISFNTDRVLSWLTAALVSWVAICCLPVLAETVITEPVITEPVITEPAQDILPGERLYLKGSAPFLNSDSSAATVDEVVAQYAHRPEMWRNDRSNGASRYFQFPFSWQKVTLRNPSSAPLELFLVCDESTVDRIKVGLIKDGKLLQQWETGSAEPYSKRLIDNRAFLLPFELQPDESVTLIIGAPNNETRNMFWVEERERFFSHDSTTALVDGAYFGAAGILSLLILLLAVVERSALYVYFYLFVVTSAFHNLIRSGYLEKLVYPDTGGLSGPLTLLTINFSFYFAILFAGSFLEIHRRQSRTLLHFTRAYLCYNTAATIAVLTTSELLYVPLVISSTLGAMIYLTVFWIDSIINIRSGHFRSRFFAFASILYLMPLVAGSFYVFQHSLDDIPTWLDPRNGEVFLTVGIYICLLYELRREKVNKQAALLEAQAKSNFFATMSHELRTPLNGVIGMAELLHQTEQTATQRKYSDIIMSSGKVLLLLINDILEYSKISNKKLELEAKPFDIDTILADCAAPFLPTMLEKQLPIYVDLQHDMPIHFIGDQYRIRQVIFNLLSNAMKFTEKGSIRLSVRARPTTTKDEYRITISVIDTGVGIDKQAQEKIFDQFSQADASTTRRFGGSGLGLSICKAIVEAMDGTISLSSEINRGSTFTITFNAPLDKEGERENLAAVSALKGKKVIAVGTHPEYCESVLSPMKNWGLSYAVAKSTEHALELLEQSSYDGIVASYSHQPWQALQPFAKFELPLLIMHFTPLDNDQNNWPANVVSAPLPASVQSLARSICSLFKARTTQKQSTHTPAPVGGDLENAPILVVEDNATNQMVALGMLKTFGLQAEVAANGQEAVNMCRGTFYPVIFMDCEMPVMDGYDATRIILEEAGDKKPVIIALTAQPIETATDRCIASGMTQILHKPVTLDQLRNCLAGIKVPTTSSR